jgi:glycosyltransferase involved in cell wall biosynthesis
MASGTPVITSSTSSMPEIGKDAAQYIDPYSTEMLTAKICEVLNDIDQQKSLIEKGYIRARQFSWANTAQQVHRCYLEVPYGKVAHQKAS